MTDDARMRSALSDIANLQTQLKTIEAATIERCAQVADLAADMTPHPVACAVAEQIAAAIRALKDNRSP